MTIGTSSGFGLWAERIIQGALLKTHRVALGQPIPPEEFDLALERLNDVIEALQDEKVFLWSVERVQFTVVEGQIVYELANDTLDVMAGQTQVKQSGSETLNQVRMISREDYYRMSDRNVTTGMALQAMVERNRTATVDGHELQGLLTMSLYPIPDNSTDIIEYTRVRALADFATATTDADVPRRWALALIGLLAAELAPEYGLDIAERRDLMERALAHERRALRGDTERTGLRFIPRMR